MAKQIIRGSTMLMIVVALAFVTTVTSAYGQSSTQQVAKIPFEFAVGDKNLPAGEYSVEAITSSGAALRIRGMHRNDSADRMTSPLSQTKTAETGKLVFRRYANHYFLTEVWMAGESTGRRLNKSARQRAIERELAAIPSSEERANSRFEIVEIAALVR